MSKVNDGGPAFPLHPGVLPEWSGAAGMTLRDYAAIHAPIDGYTWTSLSALAAFAGVSCPSVDDHTALIMVNAAAQARLRYILADAMLAARTLSEGE